MTLSSCNKVSKYNFDKVKIGMSYNEVIEILGQPIDKFTDLTSDSYLWLSMGSSYEDAQQLVKDGKNVKYIVVIFSTELSNSSQIVLNKLYGNLEDRIFK